MYNGNMPKKPDGVPDFIGNEDTTSEIHVIPAGHALPRDLRENRCLRDLRDLLGSLDSLEEQDFAVRVGLLLETIATQ